MKNLFGMTNKTMGVIYGVAILVLWFMPFRTINFYGIEAQQSGVDFGGITYLLLLGGIALAVTAWQEQHQPSMIICIVGTLISLLIIAAVISDDGFPEFGLFGIMLCFLYAGIRSFSDYRKASKLAQETAPS